MRELIHLLGNRGREDLALQSFSARATTEQPNITESISGVEKLPEIHNIMSCNIDLFRNE